MQHVTLTDAHLRGLESPKGGTCAEPIRILGDNILHAGWRSRLIGRSVLAAQWEQALAVARAGRLCRIPYARAARSTEGQQVMLF